MLEPCTSESDVLDAIGRLEAEARVFRGESEDASSEEHKCVLVHRAQKLEELIAYLRARLPRQGHWPLSSGIGHSGGRRCPPQRMILNRTSAPAASPGGKPFLT